MHANTIVIGAGIIGSAVSYELSRLGVKEIHVFDPDLEGSLSSTERNAGGVRLLWQHPVNIELARATISFCEKHAEQVGFKQNGYLWLFSKDKAQSGENVLRHTIQANLPYQRMSVNEITIQYPFIDKTDDLAFGLYGNKDGIINSNALKSLFRAKAIENGVVFHDLKLAQEISGSSGKTEVSVAKLSSQSDAHAFLESKESLTNNYRVEKWTADSIVICAGAWSSMLLNNLVKDPLIKPIRRQICLFKADDFDFNSYGMVVDPSGVYFHPEGGQLLAGLVLKDEPSGYNFKLDPDFFLEHIWPPLYERSTHFERLKPVTGWGGLYSYTKDTSGILGEIPDMPNVFEAHSFTGRGLMQSYGVAIAISDLITKRKFDRINAEALSRTRFYNSDPAKLLNEEMHI